MVNVKIESKLRASRKALCNHHYNVLKCQL